VQANTFVWIEEHAPTTDHWYRFLRCCWSYRIYWRVFLLGGLQSDFFEILHIGKDKLTIW